MPEPKQSERAAIVGDVARHVEHAISVQTFQDALHELALRSRKLICAHQTAISYLPDGDFEHAIHTHSFSDKYERYNSYDVMPTGEGIWSVVVSEQQSVCMTQEELAAHPQWRNFSHLKDARGLEHPPMRGWLAVPIFRRDGGLVGVVQASDKYEGDFDDRDLQLLQQVARLIGPSFELQYASEDLHRHSRELAQAKESLERSNADLQQFAHVASHDLQEPLRAVAGYCQLLETKLKDSDDEETLLFLKHAVEGAQRMQRLISSLLDYSRVQTMGNDFEPCEMNEVVADAIANLELQIRENEAEVSAAHLPRVSGDRSQLTLVLQNLIANSIKFRSDAKPKIDISVTETQEAWQLSVTDNGIGIAPEHFDRVFIIFQRLHTREEYPGTGLGLAISKRIVERHGGQIWCQPSEDGATVCLKLPKLMS